MLFLMVFALIVTTIVGFFIYKETEVEHTQGIEE